MVGVREDLLEAEGFDVFAADGFDRSLGSDGHEERGFDDSVRSVQPSAPRLGMRADSEEFVADAVRCVHAGQLGVPQLNSGEKVDYLVGSGSRIDVRTLAAPGLASMRAARKPIILIQICFLVFVVLYYAIPSWQSLPETIRSFREKWGLVFTLGSVWVASLVIPDIAAIVTRHERPKTSFAGLLVKLAYFGFIALAVDTLYIFLSHQLGDKPSLGVVVAKIAFDMLVFSPFLSMPVAALTFMWIDSGLNFAAMRQKLSEGDFWKRYFPTLVTCWMYFGPVTIALYSLPLALNFPVSMAAQAAWGLIITSVGSRSVE